MIFSDISSFLGLRNEVFFNQSARAAPLKSYHRRRAQSLPVSSFVSRCPEFHFAEGCTVSPWLSASEAGPLLSVWPVNIEAA